VFLASKANMTACVRLGQRLAQDQTIVGTAVDAFYTASSRLTGWYDQNLALTEIREDA
jgi:hypothetical protein